MVKCSMCPFEGCDSLTVLKHVVKRHKNNPTFHVKGQFEGCAASYQRWHSYRHLSRRHRNAVPSDALQEETREGEGPPEIILPPRDSPQSENLQENNDLDEAAQSDDEYEPPASADELLAWKAGKFLCSLRDDANCSHRAKDIVAEDVNDILLTYHNKMHGELKAAKENPEATSLSYRDIDNIFAGMQTKGLFDGVSSKYLLDQFLEANGRVETERITLGTYEFWSKEDPARVAEKKIYAFTLPLKDSLQQLLSNPEVLNYVLNPVENTDDDKFEDVRDGSWFKNHHIFSIDRSALIIIFYYDDLLTSNVLGSKPHKFAMFYWSLGNIPPHLRSPLRAINLYAVVQTKYLRKFGVKKVLSSFISDIRKLSSDGLSCSLKSRVRTFRGGLLFVTADTPAAQNLGGFKEGVGAANSPCRSCDATQETTQDSFCEADFTLRDKETHTEQVNIVTDETLSRETAKYYSKKFGINGESVFASLEDFDVTKCFVQDFMHVVFEGVLPFEIQLSLRYVVREKGLIRLSTLNQLIKAFNYGHLQTDCPSEIIDDHLDNSLRQNSLQQLALGHGLPFIFKPHIESDDSALERLKNLLILLQICNLALSYEVKSDDVTVLEHMITKHHSCLKLLYPGVNLTPKVHYMIHFPSQIKRFGPLRYQWCLRFEGGHLYFKRLMQVVLCYKNPPLTMCNRFSSKRTVQLLSFRTHSESKFLDLGDKVSKRGRVERVDGHPSQDILRAALPTLSINDSVMFAKHVVVNGTKYKENSIILLKREIDDFPQFGQVNSVVVYGREKVLLYRPLETLLFETNLNAYKVEETNLPCSSICVRNLGFLHPLSLWRCGTENFVILFNDTPEFFR